MLVDSHCHLNKLDLSAFDGQIVNILNQARSDGVQHFLCVCITPDDMPELEALASTHPDITISTGLHPNEVAKHLISEKRLATLAKHPKCIALGETGLDYFRTEGEELIKIQQDSFRAHIRAGIALNKPIIIHTRQAASDTLQIMREENAQKIGGVMHCFSENLDVAMQAIDLDFYISFSGIVTFKNAVTPQEVAQKIPLDRILIETDAPYLAPTPHRGKPNHPAWVKYVAKKIAELRNCSLETVAKATTENFYRCFNLEKKSEN